ncbi:uncharacterized protein LOC132205581 isoform X2 [Neocloeon triangulifer]|nr:uncharacterized protein LOC132205581 isoform X2 [Neocloeon triangulifer]
MLEEEERVGGGEQSPTTRRRSALRGVVWPPTPPTSPQTRRRLLGSRAGPTDWPPSQSRLDEPPTVPTPVRLAQAAAPEQQPFTNSNSTPFRSESPAGIKRVTWPPPPQESTIVATTFEQPLDFPNLQGDLVAHPPATLLYSPPPPGEPAVPMEAPPPASNSTCVFTIPSVAAPSPPPPASITLRQAAPVSQPPPPVVRSQPAVPEAAFSRRGDTKWPPQAVKVQREAEKAQQAEIAKGPACRPRRQRKDYTSFFEQHRLLPTYSHYRAPPGTQHYPEGQ